MRKLIGKYWVYYVETLCDNCNKTILCNKQSKQRKGYNFCSKTCKCNFYQKINDPKGANILALKDTPNFIYLVGLIAADGNIKWVGCTKSCITNVCSIELQKQDVKILEDIHNMFGGHIYNTKKGTYLWTLHNLEFIKYLRDVVGLSHNKSLTLDVSYWFKNLTKEQQTHFIRGIFDGDGCISNGSPSSSGYWYMGICTYSSKFLEMLIEYFNEYNYKTNKKNEIHFNGSYIIKPFYNIMTDRYLHLHRKYKKWQQFLTENI
jgi:hypothetical protein